MEHLDVVVVDAEPLGHDLRPGRVVALAVRGRPGEHLDRPGRQAADRGRLPAAGDVLERAEDARRREAAHLDVGREADAELLRVAALAPLGLLARGSPS